MAPKYTRRHSFQKILFALLFATFFFSSERSSAQCTATLTASDDTICVYGSVVLQSSPTGMYDYQWFHNGQLSILGPDSWTYTPYWFEAGIHTFSVQITDLSNCTVISNTVTVVVLEQPTTQMTGDGLHCLGSNVQIGVNTNNGTSFSWTGPNNFTSTLQNPVINNFQVADIGTYVVTVANAGCSVSNNMDIDTVTATPSLTGYVNQFYGGQNNFCEGESFMLTAEAPGFISGSYSWTGPNNFTNTGNIFWVPNVTVADSGLYTVTFSGNTCTGPLTLTDTVFVHVHTTPITSISNNGPICVGNTLQLTATGPGGTFDWSGPNNFTNNTQMSPSIPNVQQADAGTYTLHAVLGGCEMFETTNVVVMGNNPVISSNINNQLGQIHCAGQSIAMYAFGVTDLTNVTYQWDGPFMTSTDQYEVFQITNNLDSGQYILSVSGTGCSGPTTVYDTFTVDVRPCVWPGDVNNDLVTDNFDVLDLGLAYAQQGPSRPNASYQWEGQYMTDWTQTQFCGQNMKYADCNGNAIITASDTFGIALNYSLTHQKSSEHIPTAKSAANPDLYFDLTGITLTPGSIVSIPIKLGTSSIPMVNVYGLAAQIKVTGITPVNGMTVDAPAGWMGSIADALNFTKYISNNQTDWAYVRTDHNNASGDGLIAVMEFEVPTGTQYQQVQMYFDNVRIIGNTGNVITTVNIIDTSTTVQPVGIVNTSSYISDAVVIPNPSDAHAALQLTAVQDGRVQINVTDITGRKIWNTTSNTTKGVQQIILPTDIAYGMYNVEVKDDRGTIAKTLKWVKK